MEKFLKMLGALTLVLLLLCLFTVVTAYPVMWTVNYLINPTMLIALFGVSKLTFWKALALSFICGLLFKGSSSKAKKD